MTEYQVLSQLSEAFGPYVRSPSELRSIRNRVSRYIETLKPHEGSPPDEIGKFVIPGHVTGTRRRYLEAVHADILARQKYAQLRGEVHNEGVELVGVAGPGDAVASHLELLRLRKRHQQYQILSHYASEAETLAERNHIFEQHSVSEMSSNSRRHDPASSSMSDLTAETDEMSRRLEVAILQANHQLRRESKLLKDIEYGKATGSAPCSVAKTQALQATRSELTRWIEDSLMKCDSSTNYTAVDDTTELSMPIGNADHERKIRDQYERYIDERKRLLAAASKFSSPSASTESTDSLITRQPLTQNRPVNTNVNTGQLTDCRPKQALLVWSNLIKTYLPLHALSLSLSQSQSHLSSLLTEDTQDLTEQLFRLSDESHLLPSYPILAKSNSKTSTLMSGEELGEAEKLLEAWRFAIDAAGTATEATATKLIKEGSISIEQVFAFLKRQRGITEMWGKFGFIEQ